MRLPDRLDYDEMGDGDEWWPSVRCTVFGCPWTYEATWTDLGDDGDVNWNAEHPPHDTECWVHADRPTGLKEDVDHRE